MADEYIKRTLAKAEFTGNFRDEYPTALIHALIDSVPAAAVVPIVRCKDCRHRDPEDHRCDSGEFERQGCPFKVADTYFCAYGERR